MTINSKTGSVKPHDELDVTPIREIAQEVLSEVSRVIVGYGEILQQLFISLLVNGHVLLEGVPGLGKTVMAKTFAKTLGISFKRVQFTPDLLPADITGTKIFSQEQGEFVLQKGPIFANLVLADEINRSAPKTQAALLEAMAERQVTIEGQTLELVKPFIVVATENPVEMEGTYPLPEAQVDRFLFKLWLDYPEQDEEVEIMRRQISGELPSVEQITTGEEILAAQNLVNQVYIDERILKYVRDIILKTRNHPQIALGAGPRASLVLMKCSKARAAILGRRYVTPDDVRALIIPSLNHRILLKPEAELEGLDVKAVIKNIIEEIPVPI
ncbi:MAG: AAA domain-containing protein [Candidatus Lokiarchaeota archaeon]|nr:AAA domain-containing protein [Candidatus Lokiarchaeota archaeon]MBD3201240.1 AAA domain-containing protein [Candidatus Lokiarchaeota archaeon]